MRHIALEIKGKKYSSSVPSGWEDMTDKCFLCLIELAEDGSMSDYARYFSLPQDALSKIDVYTTYCLGSLIPALKPDTALSRFIIPEILSVASKSKFLSPAQELYGMTFQQFITIDTYYAWYQQTKKEEYLLYMAMCTYMKADEKFEDIDESLRLKEWSSVPKIYLKALLLNWTMIKNWLCKCYPQLFPKGAAAEKPADGKIKMFNAWSEIMDALVADDLTRLESYKRLECMDVLRILNRRIKEQQENRFKR